MWATPEESRDDIVSLYHRAWEHADAAIDSLPLNAMGAVPWWSEKHRAVTLHKVLVHVIAETHRHAGHADIVRELIDGVVGMEAPNDDMAPGDATWWKSYGNRLERAAREAKPS